MSDSALRDLGETERAVLEKLLSYEFPGVDALREQSKGLRARSIDAEGSLELKPGEDVPRADVAQRVPVEGELKDRSGMTIHVLLHVVDGLLNELDVYRDDGGIPQRELDPKELRVFTLGD